MFINVYAPCSTKVFSGLSCHCLTEATYQRLRYGCGCAEANGEIKQQKLDLIYVLHYLIFAIVEAYSRKKPGYLTFLMNELHVGPYPFSFDSGSDCRLKRMLMDKIVGTWKRICGAVIARHEIFQNSGTVAYWTTPWSIV